MIKKWLAGLLAVALIMTAALSSLTISISGASILYGDVNGDKSVDMKDVLLLRTYVAGMNPTPFDAVAADVDGDGAVTMKDVLKTRKYIANMIEILGPDESGEPTSEPVSEPVSEPTSEPVSEPTSEPISEPVSEPASEEPVSEEPVSEEPVSEDPGEVSEAPLVETVLYEKESTTTKSPKPDKSNYYIKAIKEIKQDTIANGPIHPENGEYYEVTVTGYVSSGQAYVYLAENNSWEEYHDLESVGQDLTTESGTVTVKIRQAIYGIEGEIYVADGGEYNHSVTTTYIKVSTFRREGSAGAVTIPFDPSTYNRHPDQITATLFDADSTGFGITWHTYSDEGTPVLQYVKQEGVEPDFSGATTVNATTEVYETKTMPYDLETNLFVYGATKNGVYDVQTVNDYSHKAAMTGLEPSTTYAYRVGDADAGIWSEVGYLTTRAAETHNVSFLWMSDSQVGRSDDTAPYAFMRKALEGGLTATPDAAFVVNGGDIVQSSKYLHLWRSQFNGLQDILMNIPMMPVTGNHGASYSVGGDHEIIKHFNIDYPAENDAPQYGMFYSYNYGDVHFVVVNTDCYNHSDHSHGALTDAQLNWLKADLAANTQPWTIVMMHKPMFAIRQVEEQANRLQLLDVLNDAGVDLVLQAHEHVYMRSYPINYVAAPNADPEAPQIKESVDLNPTVINDDGIEYFKDPTGVVFLTCATCGQDGKNPLDETSKDFCYAYGRGYASSWASISVEGNKLTVSVNYETDSGTQSYENGTWGIVKTGK